MTFHLDKAVDDWCAAAGAGRPGPDAAAELKDHLYCDIERRRGDGLSDHDAFLAATAALGDAGRLAAEFTKNSGCAAPSGGSQTVDPKNLGARAAIGLVQSLVWAVLMLAVSWTLRGTEYAKPVFGYVFTGWLVSWFVPLVLMDYRAAMRGECAFFRRVFSQRKA